MSATNLAVDNITLTEALSRTCAAIWPHRPDLNPAEDQQWVTGSTSEALLLRAADLLADAIDSSALGWHCSENIEFLTTEINSGALAQMEFRSVFSAYRLRRQGEIWVESEGLKKWLAGEFFRETAAAYKPCPAFRLFEVSAEVSAAATGAEPTEVADGIWEAFWRGRFDVFLWAQGHVDLLEAGLVAPTKGFAEANIRFVRHELALHALAKISGDAGRRLKGQSDAVYASQGLNGLPEVVRAHVARHLCISGADLHSICKDRGWATPECVVRESRQRKAPKRNWSDKDALEKAKWCTRQLGDSGRIGPSVLADKILEPLYGMPRSVAREAAKIAVPPKWSKKGVRSRGFERLMAAVEADLAGQN